MYLYDEEKGEVTVLGEIPGFGRVSMPYSFQTQAIFIVGAMYLYDEENGLRRVTDDDLGPVFDGIWIDSRYYMTDGEFLVVTEVSDESAIDPLKYGSSEYSPDPILAVGKTTDNKAVAFNRYSIEYFSDVAGDGFPFARISGRSIRGGLVGTHAKCQINGTYALIGGTKEETPSIHMLGVGALDRIATREIDEILKGYTETELQSAVLESRSEDSHIFLICRLARDTLMYDVATREWIILKSDVNGNKPWRARNGVYDPRNGKWIYGDSDDGRLGYLTESTPSQYGVEVEGILFTPMAYLANISISEMTIQHLPGRGATDETPRAFVSMSNDGLTHQQEYSFQMGERGSYNKKFIIRRFGYVRDYFSLKIRVVSTAPTAFSKLMIRYS
jgi:hypothetical protein